MVDWSQIDLHFDYKSRQLTTQELTDYVHALLYRYLLGISDLADRNFLMIDGRVISIDEDIEDHDTNLYKELRKNKANYIYNWLLKNYDWLQVGSWTPKKSSQIEKLKIIQNRDTCIQLFNPSYVLEEKEKSEYFASFPFS